AFRGFEDRNTQASLLIVEIPPQASAEVEKELNAAGLKKQGMTEEKRESVTLKDGKGILIVGDQEADGKKLRKWILLATMPQGTALIAVQIPEAAKSRYPDADTRAALMSTTVRDHVPIEEQLGLVPVRVDELSGMRPFRVVGNSAVFLTDGATDPQEATAQPLLIVTVAPGGPEQPSDRDNFSRRLFSTLTDFKDVRIIGGDVLRLGAGTT